MRRRSQFTNGERLWALDIAAVVTARLAALRERIDLDIPAGTLPPRDLERACEILLDMADRRWREVEER